MYIIKFEKGTLNNNHPIWPIDENASNGRISVCINPPRPPTTAFKAAMAGIRSKLYIFSLKIHSGAIFCQVDKTKAENQFKFDITDGYQL